MISPKDQSGEDWPVAPWVVLVVLGRWVQYLPFSHQLASPNLHEFSEIIEWPCFNISRLSAPADGANQVSQTCKQSLSQPSSAADVPLRLKTPH